MNPYETPRAELAWMSPQEQLHARLDLSARRWALLAVLAGTLLAAATCRPGLAFLMVHGAAAAFCLVAGARVAATRTPRWLRAGWPRWTAEVLQAATALTALGLLGTVGAASLLGRLGHPAPFGPVARLGAADRGLLLGSAGAVALAGCGLWAMTWRWRLGRSR